MARTAENQVRLAFAQEPELAQRILHALGTCDPCLSLPHSHTHTHTTGANSLLCARHYVLKANIADEPHQPKYQLIMTYSCPSRSMYKYARSRRPMRLMSVPPKGSDIHHRMSQFPEMPMARTKRRHRCCCRWGNCHSRHPSGESCYWNLLPLV